MTIHDLHGWNVTPEEAIALQRELAVRIREEPLPRTVRLVAGADVSHNRFSNTLFAAVVVLKFPEMEVVETQFAGGETAFRYRTGLLSFREAPVLLEAFRRVESPVDVAFIDGQGRAHPRRLGLACHVGLFLDRPTIGVGKTRLAGAYEEPAAEPGARSPMAVGTEVVGEAVRTRRNAGPLFVSVGHRCLLAEAVALVLQCGRGRRIPEPTRLAHGAVNGYRRRELGLDPESAAGQT